MQHLTDKTYVAYVAHLHSSQLDATKTNDPIVMLIGTSHVVREGVKRSTCG